jgi:hypothetical protein
MLPLLLHSHIVINARAYTCGELEFYSQEQKTKKKKTNKTESSSFVLFIFLSSSLSSSVADNPTTSFILFLLSNKKKKKKKEKKKPREEFNIFVTLRWSQIPRTLREELAQMPVGKNFRNMTDPFRFTTKYSFFSFLNFFFLSLSFLVSNLLSKSKKGIFRVVQEPIRIVDSWKSRCAEGQQNHCCVHRSSLSHSSQEKRKEKKKRRFPLFSSSIF